MKLLESFFEEFDRMQKSCSTEELEAWLTEQCETARKEHPEEPKLISSLYNELGSFYRHRGMLEKGKEAFLQAKALWEPLEKDANYATIINNMAGNYRMMGSFDEAVSLFQEAIEVYRKYPETPKNLVSSAFNNLALVYLDTGKFSEAADMMQAAYEVLEEAPGFEHEKATTFANMAIAYFKCGKTDLAGEKLQLAETQYKNAGLENTPEFQAFLKLKEALKTS